MSVIRKCEVVNEDHLFKKLCSRSWKVKMEILFTLFLTSFWRCSLLPSLIVVAFFSKSRRKLQCEEKIDLLFLTWL